MKQLKRLIAIVLSLLMVMALAGCGKKTITGTWNAQNDSTIHALQLNEDGSGVMDLGDGVTMNINYTKTDDKLTISTTYLGTTELTEYSYTLGKDTMTLTKDEQNIELKKDK